MFGSQTLEVAIGLIVLFTSVSLFATAIRETIEAILKQRGKFVHDALEELFSNEKTLGDFYNSITISPLFAGAYNGRSRNLPSYIVPKDFATTVVGLARKKAGDEAATAANAVVDAATQKLKNTRLDELLEVATRTAGSDPEKVIAFLEKWFDGQMERVSGWYKRITQWILLAIGAATAIVLNIDALSVTQNLYTNDALRDVIVAQAGAKPSASGDDVVSATPAAAFDDIRSYGFPMGWSWSQPWPTPMPQCDSRHPRDEACDLGDLGWSGFFLMFVGWVTTAFAVSLGAPFWFDVLNRIMVIRSTVKPFEKSGPEGSEDRPVGPPSQPLRLEVSAAPAVTQQ